MTVLDGLQLHRKAPPMSDFPTPLLFMDMETTGLRPDIHVPWELGYAVASHDTVNDALFVAYGGQSFIKVSDEAMRLADPTALAIGGFHRRYDAKNAITPERAAEILRLAADSIAHSCANPAAPKPYLVGAVPSFDSNMACIHWLGWPGFGAGAWHYHLIDVENLVAGRQRIPPPYSSAALSEAVGVSPDRPDKHTALGDVKWAIELYAAAYGLNVHYSAQEAFW